MNIIMMKSTGSSEIQWLYIHQGPYTTILTMLLPTFCLIYGSQGIQYLHFFKTISTTNLLIINIHLILPLISPHRVRETFKFLCKIVFIAFLHIIAVQVDFCLWTGTEFLPFNWVTLTSSTWLSVISPQITITNSLYVYTSTSRHEIQNFYLQNSIHPW